MGSGECINSSLILPIFRHPFTFTFIIVHNLFTMSRFCSATGKLHSRDKQICENCGANLKILAMDVIDLDVSPLSIRTKLLPALQTVAGLAIQAANFKVQAKAARPNAGSVAISSRLIGNSSKTIYRAIFYILHQKWYYLSIANQLEDEKKILPIVIKCILSFYMVV